MSGQMSLKQIKEEVGISRKAIQGYEKHGLIKSCGKNKYGHLLYDEKTVKRIRRIRFFQKYGFTVSQIRGFISKPDEEILQILAERRIIMMKEIGKQILLLQELNYTLEENKLDEEQIKLITKENNRSGI